MGARILSKEDADALRAEIEAVYGSVHRFAITTGIPTSDMYNVLNGKRPMYSKWERLINMALDKEEGSDMDKTLLDLCRKVEAISEELNDLYRKYKMEREVTK